MNYLAKLFIAVSFFLGSVDVFGAQIPPQLFDLMQQRTVIAGALVIPARPKPNIRVTRGNKDMRYR